MWSQLDPNLLELIARARIRDQLGTSLPWFEQEDDEESRLQIELGPDLMPTRRRVYFLEGESNEIVLTLRSVCRAWRGALTYAALVPCTAEPGDELIAAASRLEHVSLHAIAALPEGLRSMPALRSLELRTYRSASLPAWFAALPLTAFRVDPERAFVGPFCRWFCRAGELPPTLRRLEVQPEMFGFRHAPTSELPLGLHRFARQLSALVLSDASSFGGRFAWLEDSALVHLAVDTHLPNKQRLGPLLAALEHATVASLRLSTEEQSPGADAESTERQILGFLRCSAARASLTELSLKGYPFADGFPVALRGLRLRKLAFVCLSGLDGWFSAGEQLSALPEWLGEMPLEELEVSHAFRLGSLPRSLRTLGSLRFLDVVGSRLSMPFDLDAKANGENASDQGLLVRIWEPTPARAASQLVDDELCPLLSANPRLVLRLFSSMHSKHAVAHEISCGRAGWHRGMPGLITHGAHVRALLGDVAQHVREANQRTPDAAPSAEPDA